MTAPVSSIRNLGPASDASFARAGIHTAEQLREIGPDAAYEMLLRAGSAPHFIGYYAMVMGLQGRPWNDCKGAEKTALRARFDAIKARIAADKSAPPSGIERILDEIGTGTRR
ncbi:TfoX/Sxy family DNA transformation protein [Celeribacter sp.]|uniref:TfoX/Sxy family DNA transformation protein n=1 Tax=Celeribacter sp. TaxID=1890673 RepID=UPI003A959B3E